MRLILIRHAEAVPIGTEGIQSDFDRPLTELGHRQSKRLAEALQSQGVVPTVVLSSPLKRALQTADSLAALLTPGKEVVVTERLTIDELRPKKLSKLIVEHGGTPLLVGHMPTLAEFASWLMNANTDAIDFDKAGVACLNCEYEVARGGGTLEWLLTSAWYSPPTKS